MSNEKTKIVVIVDDGILTKIYADKAEVKVMLVDYDLYEISEKNLTAIYNNSLNAILELIDVEVNPEKVDFYFNKFDDSNIKKLYKNALEKINVLINDNDISYKEKINDILELKDIINRIEEISNQ